MHSKRWCTPFGHPPRSLGSPARDSDRVWGQSGRDRGLTTRCCNAPFHRPRSRHPPTPMTYFRGAAVLWDSGAVGCGGVVLCCRAVAVLWCCDAVAQCCCRAVGLWGCGALVLWCCGSLANRSIASCPSMLHWSCRAVAMGPTACGWRPAALSPRSAKPQIVSQRRAALRRRPLRPFSLRRVCSDVCSDPPTAPCRRTSPPGSRASWV